jgi:transposase
MELDRVARRHPGVALLRTIRGIGPRTAEAVMAYVDTPGRFGRVNQIGAYLGLVPCQDSSAGKDRLGHITRQGPVTVRKLLVEATWQVIRRNPTVKARFERITGGKKERRKIALVAMTHWLSRVMLAMLRTGEAWREAA